MVTYAISLSSNLRVSIELLMDSWLIHSTGGSVIFFHSPQGQRMQSGCDIHDYKVEVGSVECPVYHLDATTMKCRAPTDEPRNAESIYGAPRVRVGTTCNGIEHQE